MWQTLEPSAARQAWCDREPVAFDTSQIGSARERAAIVGLGTLHFPSSPPQWKKLNCPAVSHECASVCRSVQKRAAQLPINGETGQIRISTQTGDRFTVTRLGAASLLRFAEKHA